MTLEQAVLTILLAFPQYRTEHDESAKHRRARLEPVAFEIARVSQTTSDAAALITLGWRETRWSRYVGEGRCADGLPGERCDPDKNGLRQARTYWQLRRRACPQAWGKREGSRQELAAAAHCARRLFVGAFWRCRGQNAKGQLAGAYAGYRSIDCSWEGGGARAFYHGRFLRKLQRLRAK